MPTIEIAVFDANKIDIDKENFEMAILIDDEFVSHRVLFEEEFKNQNGTILHLGNPNHKNYEGAFFGSELINWESTDNPEIKIPVVEMNNPADSWGANQQYLFQFKTRFAKEINSLLRECISSSKSSKIGFLTDYQFGPEKGAKRVAYTIDEFWEIHDKEKLSFNTMYEMYK